MISMPPSPMKSAMRPLAGATVQAAVPPPVPVTPALPLTPAEPFVPAVPPLVPAWPVVPAPPSVLDELLLQPIENSPAETRPTIPTNARFLISVMFEFSIKSEGVKRWHPARHEAKLVPTGAR